MCVVNVADGCNKTKSYINGNVLSIEHMGQKGHVVVGTKCTGSGVL